MTRGLPLGAPAVLTTARLLLRPPGAGDAEAIAAIADDREVARRLARMPHPYALEDAAFFLAEIAPRELAWAITAREDESLLGIGGLVPGAVGVAELGYWLGRAHWGRGLATEAARAIVAHGRDVLGLERIASGYFTDNPASGRVLTKLGFVETGRSTQPCLARGRDLPFAEMLLA